jgi:hypothetical protein
MHPNMERPGALAGATGPDTKSECVVCWEYNISFPPLRVAYVLAFLGRLGVPRLYAAIVEVLCGPTVLEMSSWALHFAAYCHGPIHKYELVIRADRERLPVSWHNGNVMAKPVRIIGGSGQA